jgi:heme-degrading monooxygenase HmoA
MNNIEIKADNELLTLINLFNVEPQNQEELIKILKGGTESHLSKQPGYISAAIHRSNDGRHAVVYSQWRSQEDFQAVRNNPALQQYFARVREIATFEPISYEVTYVDHV